MDLIITLSFLPLLTRLRLLPRRVRLPEGLQVFVNDPVTLRINIPDHYALKEYMLHRDFMPMRGWVVVDAGAYVGIYSLWASRRVGDEGFVVAFEPNPLALQALMLNIELNNAKNVHVLPYALGDEFSVLKLFIAKENVEASSLIKGHVVKNPGGPLTVLREYPCPVAPFDHFLSSGLLSRRVERVDLMKIDVEGYEMKVLRGCSRALTKGLVDRLVIEVHVDQAKTSEVIEYLKEFGYRAVGVKHFGEIKDVLYVKNNR